MAELIADLRVTCRALLARPGYAVVVVLTLGLGVGANTAIFSAVNALLLRPLPFPDADRLVRITTVRGDEEGSLAVPEQDDLAALGAVFAGVALYTDQGMYNASGFGAPEELPATITTANLFRVLGVPMAIGSPFDSDADRTRRFELVISHGLWARRFGQDPHIVGRTMTLDGSPGYTIHGVLPPGVNFPAQSDLFRSSGISAEPAFYARRDVRQRMALARLQPGVTVAQAQSAVDRLAERLAREFPATNAALGFRVVALRELYVGDVRPYLLLLLAAVALVLLIACANVANLLLSRAIGRERELAVRLALGAGRRRLVQLTLVESGVLAGLGGLAGLLIAAAGIRLVTTFVPAQLPPWMRIELDVVTLAFLGGLSAAAGLLSGLAPALAFSERGLHQTLREGGRGAAGGGRHRKARRALIVVEVALATVLLAGASQMLQSVRRLQAVDAGFDVGQLLTFRVEMGWRAYDTHDKVIQFNAQLLERLGALPGVTHVALDSNLPLSGRPREPYEIVANGQSIDERRANPFVHVHVVSPGYFDTMRLPISRGRDFTETDAIGGAEVVVVSERLAARLWPGRDPIGQQVQVGSLAPTGDSRWSTIVGVVRDIRLQHVADGPGFDLYRPYRQMWVNGFWFAARTAGAPPGGLAQAATALVSQIDPDQSSFDVRTMDQRIDAGIWQQRAVGALFAAFSALALSLAAVGLYGVLSYLVLQQQREIGVRLALGATAGAVLATVLRRGLGWTTAGILIGTAASIGASRAIGHLTYDPPRVDLVTILVVPIVLLTVSTLACYLPARRATRVDPLVTLRSE